MKRTPWLLLASLMWTGCQHASNSLPTAAGVASDTVWYVSARARDDGHVATRLSDSLEYGFVVAEHPRDRDPLSQGLQLVLRDSTRITRSEFVAALRARATAHAPVDTAVVLYVHGFGTWQHEALANTATSIVRSRSSIPWVVFCWPSKGSGVASPSTRAVFTTGYWNDSTAAAASIPAFGDALGAVLESVGGAHVVLVAHSMGSQIVSEALTTNATVRSRLATDRLRSLAFFAPDLDAERFQKVTVPAAHPLAKRVLLYASKNDRTLAMSKVINKRQPAGRDVNGMPASSDPNAQLETIDVSDSYGAGGWFQRHFGSHHALNRASAALFDLVHIVAREFPPACRVTLGTAMLHDGGVWRLTDVSPPSPRAVDACATVR